MDREYQIQIAAAEVIAAFREHEAMLLIGGHEPKRLKTAVDALDEAMKTARRPQAA